MNDKNLDLDSLFGGYGNLSTAKDYYGILKKLIKYSDAVNTPEIETIESASVKKPTHSQVYLKLKQLQAHLSEYMKSYNVTEDNILYFGTGVGINVETVQFSVLRNLIDENLLKAEQDVEFKLLAQDASLLGKFAKATSFKYVAPVVIKSIFDNQWIAAADLDDVNASSISYKSSLSIKSRF
jgi:hypothetical protein